MPQVTQLSPTAIAIRVGLRTFTIVVPSARPLTPAEIEGFRFDREQSELLNARAAWKRGNREAVAEAVRIIRSRDAPGEWPSWLVEAMADVLLAPPEPPKRGRTGNALARRRADRIDKIRARLVDELLAKGESLRAACKLASTIIQGDPAGSPKVMAQSHRRFHERRRRRPQDFWP
jgi:hypothetical protein